MAAPTRADTIAYAAGFGVTLPDSSVTDTAIAEAIEVLSQQTGYRPFIGASASVEVSLPKTIEDVCFFPTGVVSITSITANTAALSAGTDYVLFPTDAPLKSRPFEGVKFRRPVQTTYGTIQVDASWGFAADYPDWAKRAIMHYATAHVLMGTSQADAGSVGGGWQDGDVAQHGAGKTAGSKGSDDALGGAAMAQDAIAMMKPHKRNVYY